MTLEEKRSFFDAVLNRKNTDFLIKVHTANGNTIDMSVPLYGYQARRNINLISKTMSGNGTHATFSVREYGTKGDGELIAVFGNHGAFWKLLKK